MTLHLRDIAQTLGASFPSRDREGAVSNYSIDSRTIEPGSLFFALRGPAHDGHDYVAQALAKGAAAAVVEEPVAGPTIRVPNTLEALQRLAGTARARFSGHVIAVTGSAGKTTTKDTIAALLASCMPVGKTIGNFNNHVGLPLSILRLPDDARAWVLEIGMNHAGEIRALAAIARPTIAVVTNVGYAHVENFDSIEGVALAKRELVESLPADGIAVLNADDVRVAAFARVHPGRTVTFGFSPDACVSACPIARGFRLSDGLEFSTRMSGRHAILNILAGIATARALRIDPASLRDAVASLEPGKMRGERFEANGITILNDCYNSNPEAARSMIDVLRDTPAQRRIAVLGEMLELGRWSESLHRDVGRYVAESGIDVLVGIRGAARYTVDQAVASGLRSDAAFFFEEAESAGDFVRQYAQSGDAILFKGSRGTRVERALERLLG
jgi:UDP-N-acetylmuramoyl-tripeptide--D-alanyl-D-alanine ligase